MVNRKDGVKKQHRDEHTGAARELLEWKMCECNHCDRVYSFRAIADVLQCKALTNGGNGCHDLTKLQLVENGGLTSSIQSDL